ncbi:HMG box-containing protein 1-like isoform X2 [Brienomyrus brachyistius]|uniref:HMG box-containing protein 1-like isoform X2 n=1 Tax=Brienomyrus brachyistius TaxID=42636 RepID=UPI0020B23BAE|nr:HMG box-containing protein 1-like isoform X2 [Brienomyrus brachyistius]
MATGLSQCNMVWEVKPQLVPDRRERTQLVKVQDGTRTDIPECKGDLQRSPGREECDDLPDLKEVLESRESPEVFQVAAGVSHHEQQGDAPNAGWLTELANIATSPQSPLLQGLACERPSSVHIFSTSNSLHSYARMPPAPSSTPRSSRSQRKSRMRTRASGVRDPGPSCTPLPTGDNDMGWSHSWPSAVWHCFLKGTRLYFHKGPGEGWQVAEDLGSQTEELGAEGDSRKSYGSEGLKLVAHEETVSFGQSVLKLTFDPGLPEDGLLTAECRLDHPFYVRSKGWSSFYPSLTAVQHGIPCYELRRGDLCLQPGHPDAVNGDDSIVFDTFKSYAFTPLDSSAVYVLSSMARLRRASPSSEGAVTPLANKMEEGSECPSTSPSSTKSHSSGMVGRATPTKCKRPMNAFMLFAKKYRVEYTQMHPGKDNRAISVILGDKWRKMKNEERKMYTMEAKALAEEQRRLNPDCWKRRRTSSGSQHN